MSQAAEFALLQRAGATPLEAAQILLAVAEVDRVIELASGAWRHELRGKGGRWVPSGAVARTPRQKAAQRTEMQAAYRAARAPAAATAQKHATTHQVAYAQAQTLEIATQAAREHARSEVGRLMKQVEQKHEEFTRQLDTREGHKARLKLAGVLGTLVGGAVMAYVESRLGLPDAAQIATSISPSVAEALFEAKKRL